MTNENRNGADQQTLPPQEISNSLDDEVFEAYLELTDWLSTQELTSEAWSLLALLCGTELFNGLRDNGLLSTTEADRRRYELLRLIDVETLSLQPAP